MRSRIGLKFLISLSLLAQVGACASDDEVLEAAREPLPPVVAANLAHPELDLNVPVGWWWMHDADATLIQGRINAGYRLTGLDVVNLAPLRFAASFVANSGVYARTGNGFDPELTEAELLAIKADPNRRIVDLALYKTAAGKRYAAVWLGNTGTQKKTYELILDKTETGFTNAVTAFNGRVTDVALLDGRLHGVMIKNLGDDKRTQWFGLGKGKDAVELVSKNNARLADLEHWAGDWFYFVAEEVRGSVGEQTWWAADLVYDGTGSLHNPDSLAHQPARFGGRFSKLKGYPVVGGTRYFGLLADNAAVPRKGSDNAGNATLAKIDAAVERQMKKAGIPGATLAVVRNGKLIHAKGYGYSDLQNSRVTEPTDLFRLASVSKTLGGAAVLRLIQDGAKLPAGSPWAGQTLSLSTRPFGQLWAYTAPNRTPNLGQITIRHLLEHSTGLADGFEWNMTPADWIATETSLGDKSFNHAPGQNGWPFYRNAHYHMLGNAVAAISGKTFDQYVQQTFMDPLSIKRVRVSHVTGGAEYPGTFQAVNYERPGRFARQSFDKDGVLQDGDVTNRGDWVLSHVPRHAASSYAASPIDLLRFAVSLDGSRAGVRALDATRWALVQSGISAGLLNMNRFLTWFGPANALNHGGYLPGVTHAHMRLLGSGVKYAFASNSDSMTQIATQSSNQRSFEWELIAELDALFAAEAALLPDRDLFDTYVPPPCGSDFHALSMSLFQPCFNHWTAKNLWPQTLTVSPDGTRISGSFQAIAARRTHHLIPAATYEAITQEEFGKGSIPHHVNVVNLNGDLRFTATWLSAGGAGYGSWWNMSFATFSQKFNELYATHMLTDMFVYNDNGLKVAATWKKMAHSGYAAWAGLTDATFATKDLELRNGGFKVVHFLAYSDAGQTRYAAIWKPVAGDWLLTRDASGAAYQSTYNAKVSAGYKLHQLHRHGVDAYAAVWKRNASE